MSLANKLDQIGKQRGSAFEQAVRAEGLQTARVFIGQNGALRPVLFLPTQDIIGKTSAADTAQFPRLENVVLKASNQELVVKGKRIAVLFSGGPAAGGHNVIAGIYKVLGQNNTLLGVRQGPKGLIKGSLFEINETLISEVMNAGGFDLLMSDRTKITEPEQFAAVRKTVQDNRLDGIVVIGGDDSNTNAAVLAEYLIDDNCTVVGVPKTIDGDLQAGKYLPISFGFDTATKIYAEMVGNILTDSKSSGKYWHFIKLMGRSASHVALEVALQTRPHVVLISEEIEHGKQSLASIIEQITQVVIKRGENGINYGVVVLPEGIIEFIPEMKVMINELSQVSRDHAETLDQMDLEEKKIFILKAEGISRESKLIFQALPKSVVESLFVERDPHGNLQVSKIPSEVLFMEMVGERVKSLQKANLALAKINFAATCHFYGYDGRCGAPSRFDAEFTFNLGLVAGSLVLAGKTGYMASVTDLFAEDGCKPLAIPLISLIHMEERHGKSVPVIEKALVELDSPAFQYLSVNRVKWGEADLFHSPGPIQHWGVTARQVPITVALNQGYPDYLGFNIGMIV